MKEADPRINAGSMTVREYLLTLLLCNILSASLIQIYATIHDNLTRTAPNASIWQTPVLLFGVGGYVLFASVVLSLIFMWWRRTIMKRKIDVLSDAARRVTEGDLSVRIAPQRTDGKKDEFEVLYEDFNTMADRLEGKTILREDFLSNISHEFRTPLSVINNYITILQSDGLSAADREMYMERIRQSSEQLSGMVGNVLQISRLENNRISANYTSFDLSEQLVRTILGFDQAFAEKDIELDTDIDDAVTVFSDKDLLQLVWNNLLSNAVKFTPEGGSIFVDVHPADHAVHVTVRDNGCGISPEDQARVFEKFYQADHSHSTKGNGLGLALVKNICTLLNCTIQLTSQVGKGASFTVSVPLRNDPAAPVSLSQNAARRQP